MTDLFTEPNPPAAVETLKAYVATRPDTSKTSNKIPAIRRLWHDYKGENFYLEGCLAAALKAVGDTTLPAIEGCPDIDYAFLIVLSGTLFTQTYGDMNDDGMAAALGQRVMPHMFGSLGRDYLYIDRATVAAQPALAMEAVKTAIDKGVPVISLHTSNWPRKNHAEAVHTEWCIVGGYDADGTLYANVYYDDAVVDEHGYCAVKDGLAGSEGLYILGEKRRDAAAADLFHKAVRAIPSLVTQSRYNGVAFGRQAYHDWADALLDEANWGNTATNLSENPYEEFLWKGHNAPWIVALTNECYMRVYFGRMAEYFAANGGGEFPEVAKVWDVYMRIHARLPEIQKFHGGEFFATPAVIAKPEVRKQIAAILREMGDLHGDLLALFDGK